MYDFIDKNIKSLKEKNRKSFNNMRLGIMSYDELNMLVIRNKNKKLFETLKSRDRKFFEELIEYLKNENKLEGLDIDSFLSSYNPTLLFVYSLEVIRKEARFFESLIAIGSEKNEKELSFNGLKAIKNQNRNVNNWNRQVEEIAVDMEREVWINTYKNRGYKKLQWVTAEDEKVCEECGKLDGQIFEISELPSRPHIHCRCTFKPVEQTE